MAQTPRSPPAIGTQPEPARRSASKPARLATFTRDLHEQHHRRWRSDPAALPVTPSVTSTKESMRRTSSSRCRSGLTPRSKNAREHGFHQTGNHTEKVPWSVMDDKRSALPANAVDSQGKLKRPTQSQRYPLGVRVNPPGLRRERQGCRRVFRTVAHAINARVRP